MASEATGRLYANFKQAELGAQRALVAVLRESLLIRDFSRAAAACQLLLAALPVRSPACRRAAAEDLPEQRRHRH